MSHPIAIVSNQLKYVKGIIRIEIDASVEIPCLFGSVVPDEATRKTKNVTELDFVLGVLGQYNLILIIGPTSGSKMGEGGRRTNSDEPYIRD